jgi:hypothetical protein
MKNRNALYLGERDKDIKEYISPLLNHYDFSSIVRDLIRDGIKYRRGVFTPPPQNVLQSMNTSEPLPLEKIVLKEKELNLDDISDKLDNL